MQVRNMEFAWLANFVGCPALSAPVGFLEGEGGKVPVGLMGMGEWGGEEGCLGFGYDLETFLEGDRVRPGNWVDVMELAKKEEGGGVDGG